MTVSGPAIASVELLVAGPQPWTMMLTRFGYTVSGHMSVPDDREVTVLRADEACVLLTVPCAGSATAARLAVHGPGIRGIALDVGDLDAVFQSAVAAGATPVWPPQWRVNVTGDLQLVHTGTAVVDFGALRFTLRACR